MAQLADFPSRFFGKRVLVVGDLFLDEYIVGRPSRISREAPVMVLEFEQRFTIPGGGANPAYNVQSLGGQAFQLGVIGQDQGGEQLRQALQQGGVNVDGLVVDPSRPTTTKTRIVAVGSLVFPQQIARVDHLDRRPVEGVVEQRVVDYLESVVPLADATLISDYKTGVVTQTVVEAVLSISGRYGRIVAVDSQGDLNKFRGCTVVKCNHHEAENFLHRPLSSEGDFQEAEKRLLDELEAQAVMITRGGDGISVLGRDIEYTHLPAANRSEVFDVTGAGDTVIAVLTLGLTAGATLVEAARMANHGAGLVVRKLGNATVTPEELAAVLSKEADEAGQ